MSLQPLVPLRAERRQPATAGDLLDGWAPGGLYLQRRDEGIASSGSSLTVEVPTGADQMARAARAAEAALVELEGPARSQMAAVAALPYDGGMPASVIVPARLLRRQASGGDEICIEGNAAEGAEPGPVARSRTAASAAAAAGPGVVVEEPDAEAFAAAVREAVRRIRAGHLEKVVLARSLRLAGAHDPRAVLVRLRAADPNCYSFASPGSRPGSVVVGATPELLVRRRGSLVVSTPLGGSAPRSADPVEDRAAAERLLASTKDRREHGLVLEAVTDSLSPFCSALEIVGERSLTSTAGLWHLGSTVRGTLKRDAPGALALAAALHPTPAICGTPRGAALGVIRELEPVPRGLYSGLAGWVDGRGDGDWVVVLRCAELGAGGARLHAGAGIVEGSDPAAELAETRAKFSAVLDALS